MSTPPGQIPRQVLQQQQRLILTQELQLFLKLIQMTTLELKEYLEEQLVENPVLEEKVEEEEKNAKDEPPSSDGEFDFSADEKSFLGSGDDNLPYFKEVYEDYEEESPWENRVSSPESLLDYLRWQLSLSDFSDEEKEIASLIIGNINEDGYLETDVEEIALMFIKWKFESAPDVKELSEEEKTGFYENLVRSDKGYTEKVKSVLRKIQSSFDPTGVCARNLKECLRIQAEAIGYKDDSTVIRIIENHLEDISKKDYKGVSEALGCSVEKVEEAASVISSLEPKPGRPFYLKDAERYIVPDFYVYKLGNELQIQLNRDFPKVRISQYYRNLINMGSNLPTDVKKYIKEKMEAAQRIIKCLEERDQAIKRIITKIIEFQKDFFEHGKDYIKPLRLKDIAQAAGVHESTVSRITSRRYIYTPSGVIELKSLFSRKIETSHGADVSFEKVKSLIKEIVSNELPESPYSDEDISKILERRNIKVARRTVAKYRKILKIPSSSNRAKKKG
jgi:RNA polymerase sigma-54 factor